MGLPSFALSLYVSSFCLFHWFKSLPQRQLALHIPASLQSLLQDDLCVLPVLSELGKLLSATVPLRLEILLFLRVTAPPEFIIDTAALLLHGLNLLLCSGNELFHLLCRFQPLTAQQTGLGGDCVQPLQLQPQCRGERFARRPALWDSPQQVAVVEVEPVEITSTIRARRICPFWRTFTTCCGRKRKRKHSTVHCLTLHGGIVSYYTYWNKAWLDFTLTPLSIVVY